MRITAGLALLLALVLALPASASAEEGSLLAKLEAECVSLASRADAATAWIRPIGIDRPDAATLRRNAKIALAQSGFAVASDGRVVSWSYSPELSAGVLVGNPPVLVAAAESVGDAKAVSFRLADGAEGKAELWAAAPELGVAVFRLPPAIADGREGLTLGDTPAVPRGRLALVPGLPDASALAPLHLGMVRGSSPLSDWFAVDGLPDSVPSGLPALSTNGRLIGIAVDRIGNGPAATSPGNLLVAGDALPLLGRILDQDGRPLRSLVTALDSGGGNDLPCGSFLAGALIARVLADLREHGAVRMSYLGVILGGVRGEGEKRGVEVRSVLEGSPAARAGLRAGVAIRAANGHHLSRREDLERILALARPGETIQLEIDMLADPLPVVLGERSDAIGKLTTPEEIGIDGLDLAADLVRFLGLPEGFRGVVVRTVRPGSPAAAAGIARGDVIVGGGGEPIVDLEELRAALASVEDEITVEIRRGDANLTKTIRIGSESGGERAR